MLFIQVCSWVSVVYGQDRLVEVWGDPLRDARVRGLDHLRRRHPGLEPGEHHLGVPPVDLGFRDPAQAVAVHAQPTFDHRQAKPFGDLCLDQRDDLEFVLAEAILRLGFNESHGLADEHQQLDGDPRLLGDLLERDLGQRRQAIVGRRIQEPERQVAALDRSGYPPERHPGPFERLQQADPPHIALGEVAVRGRGEDPEFDQHDDVIIGDPRAIGHLTDRVSGQ
jgi:hypothetical protein